MQGGRTTEPQGLPRDQRLLQLQGNTLEAHGRLDPIVYLGARCRRETSSGRLISVSREVRALWDRDAAAGLRSRRSRSWAAPQTHDASSANQAQRLPVSISGLVSFVAPASRAHCSIVGAGEEQLCVDKCTWWVVPKLWLGPVCSKSPGWRSYSENGGLA